MVRALASHQCGPGSIPGPGVICGLRLLLVLVFVPRGFSPGTPVFPSPQKPTFPNSNSIRNPRATGFSVPDCCVSPSLNKVDLFIFIYFIYLARNRMLTRVVAKQAKTTKVKNKFVNGKKKFKRTLSCLFGGRGKVQFRRKKLSDSGKKFKFASSVLFKLGRHTA